MGATERTWVYYEQGRLIPVRTSRPTGKGPWCKPRPNATLVVAVEGVAGDLRTPIVGPMYEAARVPEAVKLHLGIEPANFKPAVWTSVPNELKRRLASRVRDASTRVSQQWARASNEETLTGVFFGEVSTTLREGGWTAHCNYIEFSKQSKEHDTGADLAIILDVLNSRGDRAFKSIWLQAKTARSIPSDIRTLPRLSGQIDAMRNYTQEAYALIYTPQGVVAVSTAGRYDQLAVDVLLERAMACTAGDPDATLLGNSMNRRYVLEVLIEQAKVVL